MEAERETKNSVDHDARDPEIGMMAVGNDHEKETPNGALQATLDQPGAGEGTSHTTPSTV